MVSEKFCEDNNKIAILPIKFKTYIDFFYLSCEF